MMDFGSVSLLLCTLTLVGLPRESAMQTESITEPSGTAITSIIDYSVALYVLIGIAVFYSIATLICCILVVLNCLSGKGYRREKRVSPYANLKHPLPSRLETILEESESRCSSHTSLKQHKKEGLSFQNQFALDALVNEMGVAKAGVSKDLSGEPDIEGTVSIANKSVLEHESSSEEDLKNKSGDLEKEQDIKGRHALSFSNKTALERQGSEEDLMESEGSSERGTVIAASFRKPVPIGKINGQGKTKSRDQSDRGSPFLRHIPRGSSVSPADVKVPFSEPDPEPKLKMSAGKKDTKGDMKSPRRSRPNSVSSGAGSPFSKRKNPGKQIPSSSPNTLTDFKKKASAVSNAQSQEPAYTSTGKIILPPIEHKPSMVRAKESTRPKTKPAGVASQSESTGTGSPVRSRPHPAHPVQSSPSRSPFQQARVAKDSTPGIAIHSRSSAEQAGAADTSRSSSGSSASIVVLTVDVMVKKLQPVQKKWFIIGKKLKVPIRRLNFIVNKHKNVIDKCLSALCEEWVSTSEEATWPRVVDALKSDLVNEKELACDIEREFCWVESNNSKTWL